MASEVMQIVSRTALLTAGEVVPVSNIAAATLTTAGVIIPGISEEIVSLGKFMRAEKLTFQPEVTKICVFMALTLLIAIAVTFIATHFGFASLPSPELRFAAMIFTVATAFMAAGIMVFVRWSSLRASAQTTPTSSASSFSWLGTAGNMLCEFAILAPIINMGIAIGDYFFARDKTKVREALGANFGVFAISMAIILASQVL